MHLSVEASCDKDRTSNRQSLHQEFKNFRSLIKNKVINIRHFPQNVQDCEPKFVSDAIKDEQGVIITTALLRNSKRFYISVLTRLRERKLDPSDNQSNLETSSLELFAEFFDRDATNKEHRRNLKRKKIPLIMKKFVGYQTINGVDVIIVQNKHGIRT